MDAFADVHGMVLSQELPVSKGEELMPLYNWSSPSLMAVAHTNFERSLTSVSLFLYACHQPLCSRLAYMDVSLPFPNDPRAQQRHLLDLQVSQPTSPSLLDKSAASPFLPIHAQPPDPLSHPPPGDGIACHRHMAGSRANL